MNEFFDAERQNKLAESLRQLHHQEETLVIPNAWDATSAKIFEQSDFPAIATTSSGISWACGYRDVENIPPPLMIQMVHLMARVINRPLSADIEGGYFEIGEKFTQFFSNLIEAGAVGINLEDSHDHQLLDLKSQIQRIKQVRQIAEEKGVHLFINARTDVMALRETSIEEKIKESVERAQAYQEAGADGIFVPFVKEMDVVKELKEQIQLPLNILYTDSLSVLELKELGVDRISLGSHPILATLHLLKKIAFELKDSNHWHYINSKDLNYSEINHQF